MPVFSGSSVSASVLSARSGGLTLAEIASKLSRRKPKLDGRVGGWAGIEDAGSNMGLQNVAPPESDPVLGTVGEAGVPALFARYYFWQPVPSVVRASDDSDIDGYRKLDALDVIVTEAAGGRLTIVISSRNVQLLNRRDGALKDLEGLLRLSDSTIRLERETSELRLLDADIFLWLAAQLRDEPQLSAHLLLDRIISVSGTDAVSRSSYLKSGVDFDRPNFLTAVAEADTLGPMEVVLVADRASGARDSFGFALHKDGGFELRKNDVQYSSPLEVEVKMVRASRELAYDLIPQINGLYGTDGGWPEARVALIRGVMDGLARRYKDLLQALEDKLEDADLQA